MLHKKIIIIGEAGRGKSTLAKKLSKKLNIPHFSTDDFYWETKFTIPRDKEKSLALINEQYAKNEWIIEGTTQWLIKPALDDADMIIYLYFKNIWHQWFYISKRYFERKNTHHREKLIPLLKHVFYKRYNLGYKKGAVTHTELIAPYENKVIRLSSFKQINDFMKTL